MSPSLLLALLRTEGARAVRDRLLDRWQEQRRLSRFAPLTLPFHSDVLNVLTTPPVPRLGGVQVQLLARLAEEARSRACALLYSEAGGYRLEVSEGSRLETRVLPTHDFAEAARSAAALVGARIVHLEGLAEVPLEAALALSSGGLRLVISVHDFTGFCRRPHLLAVPEHAFCGYCRDLDRCLACLRHDFEVDARFQPGYREQGAALLRGAQALVFPSRFMRDAWADLCALDPARLRIIPPTCPTPSSPRRELPGGLRHVAYVGAVNPQKGAWVFEELVKRGPRGLRWSAFGKGEGDCLRRLRALANTTVRGYYRTGSLSDELSSHQVDLALALSITPESYGLTVDECLAVGVPVIAFDHGAVAERLRATGAGAVVPLQQGWKGVAEAIEAHRSGTRRLAVPSDLRLPDPRSAAEACHAIYQDLLTQP